MYFSIMLNLSFCFSFVKKFKDEFEARGAADEAAQLEANQKGTVNSAN